LATATRRAVIIDPTPNQRSLLTAFGFAVAGAVQAVVVWYVLDAFTGGALVAFVRTAGWPVSTAWLVAGVGAVAGVIVGRRRKRQEHERAAGTATTAADFGLTYTETVPRPEAKLPCFTHWERGRNGVSGAISGVPVSAFDLTERIPGGESDTIRERAVVLMPVELPAFGLSPLGRYGWIARVFGFGGMRFDPDAADPLDTPVVRRFDRTFRLDPTNATEPMPDDASHPPTDPARRLFTPSLMAAVLDHPDWSIKCDGEWLAVLRDIRPEADRGEWLTAAVGVRAALLASAANPPAEGLPSPPLRTYGQNAALVLGTLVGGVLGSFGAFFGCAPLAMGNGIPFLPFLGAAGGGVAGGLIGFVLGAMAGWLPAVRGMKPVDPAEQKRPGNRWVQAGGCLGFFAGFFGGFVAFIALIELVFGWDGMKGWLAMFPILSFGGGFAGALAGGMLGSRIARRKNKPAE
jgi:MFS family permease